jgi:hypothetical protein
MTSPEDETESGSDSQGGRSYDNRPEAGTGRTFEMDHNARWLSETRPILEAFFHARYFLETAVRYAKELEQPPQVLPRGWAALLALYRLR